MRLIHVPVIESRHIQRDIPTGRHVAPGVFRPDGADVPVAVPLEDFQHLVLTAGLVAARPPGLIAPEVGLRAQSTRLRGALGSYRHGCLLAWGGKSAAPSRWQSACASARTTNGCLGNFQIPPDGVVKT
jgi:hypothetical protein